MKWMTSNTILQIGGNVMLSEIAFNIIYTITVIWLIGAAVYTYITVFQDFKELMAERKNKKREQVSEVLSPVKLPQSE